MKKTNKYYIDKDGNMIHYTRYNPDKTEVIAEPFHAELKIIGINYLHNGFCFKLQDKNGKIYIMNDVMFGEYIHQNDIFLEGDWDFYKQGTAFSIGLKENETYD